MLIVEQTRSNYSKYIHIYSQNQATQNFLEREFVCCTTSTSAFIHCVMATKTECFVKKI